LLWILVQKDINALKDRFHLPSGDTFHLQIAAFAEETDMEILRVIVMPANGGLAVVGKDLNQVLINKYAYGQIFPSFNSKGGLM
jgi:hypothetical protein